MGQGWGRGRLGHTWGLILDAPDVGCGGGGELMPDQEVDRGLLLAGQAYLGKEETVAARRSLPEPGARVGVEMGVVVQKMGLGLQPDDSSLIRPHGHPSSQFSLPHAFPQGASAVPALAQPEVCRGRAGRLGAVYGRHTREPGLLATWLPTSRFPKHPEALRVLSDEQPPQSQAALNPTPCQGDPTHPF